MTTTATQALPDFLLARIAERESDVQRRGTNAVGHPESCSHEGGYEGDSYCDCGAVGRALVACSAKRRIVELHRAAESAGLAMCSTCEGYWPCATLIAVATVYADHPDYPRA